MAEESRKIEMVNCYGVLHENEVKKFIGRLPANENITVVSIIGRQNTGKSYLLNRLFGTNFDVLDDEANHGRTTSGIWIAQSPKNPSIVVIDIEGSDSSTNAQKGTSFANQAALFALVISDVLLLNMDVRGLDQNEGGSVPLLQTIFRERISLPRCKTRIEVTLRDCRNLTNDRDIRRAHEIIKQCWASRPANGRLEDFIEVSVERFPNATDTGKDTQKAFESKVTQLRDKLTRLTPTQPRDMLRNNVLNIWPAIRSNKNLDIPSFNETLSTHWCNTIMQEELSSLDANKAFSQLRNMEDTSSPVEFQRMLAEFLTCTSERFDKSTDGSLPKIRDDFKARLQKEITNKLEDKFSKILRTATSKIVDEKKELISSHLVSMKKGILSSIFTLTFNFEAFESNIDVDSIVNEHVREFDQLFKDCREEYRKYVSFCRDLLKKSLKDYAKQETNEIEESHKIYVAIGKGTLIVIGVATSGYLLGWGGSILLASRPALATWSRAALSKIPTLVKYMLQNIITPAVKICAQSMMECQQIAASHLAKLMFDFSVAGLVFLVPILSIQQHSQPYSEKTYNGAPTKSKLPKLEYSLRLED